MNENEKVQSRVFELSVEYYFVLEIDLGQNLYSRNIVKFITKYLPVFWGPIITKFGRINFLQ